MPSLRATGLLAMLGLAASAAAAQPVQTDLRDLRVGMAVGELPRTGYTDLTCTGPDRKTVNAWSEFKACPPDERGAREIGFRYDDNPDHETQVAGQPVLLSLVLSASGVVEAIKMRTDPGGRVFSRKRGVHFGERVMAHYGEGGWSCREGEPTAQERPVGTIFVREHCEKTLGVRHLVVDRALFRGADQPQDAFTSASWFTVSLIEPNAR